MNKRQRVRSVFKGLFSFLLAVLLIIDPEAGCTNVVFILNIALLLSGLSSLVYYITMTRFMVGGQLVLYRAVLLLDLAVFTLVIIDIPKFFILLYLVIIHAANGAVLIANSLNKRKMKVPSWKLKFLQGVASLAVAVVCIVFSGSMTTVVFVYSLGLIFSGCMSIISAFRRTAVVYIQ